MKKNKSGFTLIELLVVIAIIGLLSTLSILALNQARARARDAKRVSDIRQIQTALEMYYDAASKYPSNVVAGGKIEYKGNIYLGNVPSPAKPYDGSVCADSFATLVQSANGSYPYKIHEGDYQISYCLGASVNDIEGNKIWLATPAGMTTPYVKPGGGGMPGIDW